MFTTLKVINKKSHSPQQLLHYEILLKNKRIFKEFCNHFKELSLEQLQNDYSLVEYFAKWSQQDIALYSRAFQLALEVSYNKRRFSHKALKAIMGVINLQDKETQIKAAKSTFDVLNIINIENIP